jgi:hypothetical protein
MRKGVEEFNAERFKTKKEGEQGNQCSVKYLDRREDKEGKKRREIELEKRTKVVEGV